jgi:hypothetical protein
MLKHTSLLRVVNESEKVLVDKLWRKSSTNGVGAKLTSAILLRNLTFSTTQASPGAYNPFLVVYKCFYYLSPIICALSYRD